MTKPKMAGLQMFSFGRIYSIFKILHTNKWTVFTLSFYWLLCRWITSLDFPPHSLSVFYRFFKIYTNEFIQSLNLYILFYSISYIFSYDLTLMPNMANTDVHLVQFDGAVNITFKVYSPKERLQWIEDEIGSVTCQLNHFLLTCLNAPHHVQF